MADEFDEAISRIRGPQVEDFFSAPAPATRDTRPAPSMVPEDLDPDPDSWGAYGKTLLRRAPGMAVRAAGAVAGFAAGTPTGPGALVTTGLGLTAAEPWAEIADYYMLGEEPSVVGGVINIGAGLVGGTVGGKVVGNIVKPYVGATAARIAATATGQGIQGPIVANVANVAKGGGLIPPAEIPGIAVESAAFGAVMHGAYEGGSSWRAAQHVAKQKRAAMPEAVVASHQNGGATFDLDGNDRFGTDAWAVGVPGRSKTIPGTEEFTPGHVKDYVTERGDDFGSDPRVHVGSWNEKGADGNTLAHWLNPTVLIKDRDAAEALGRKWGEKSITNLKTLESIDTGGTGENVGPPKSMKELLADVPYESSSLFGRVRGEAGRAATQLHQWYKASPLSDKKGEIRLDVLTGGGFRSDPKLKMSPDAQATRRNLSRLAADDIMHGSEPTNQEKWSAKMVERYGKDVTPHLAQAWKNGNVLLDRVAKGSITELPNTAKAIEMLHAGKDVAEWYDPMHRELKKYFGPDTETFMRFVAITSPRQNIKQNLQSAMKLYVQWKAGAREASPEAVEMARAKRQNSALRANGAQEKPLPTKGDTAEGEGFRSVLYPEWAGPASRGEDIGGPKVRNFFYGMRGDKSKGDHNAIVIDSWIQRYMGYKESINAEGEAELPSMSDTEYEIVSDYLRVQAEKTGVSPPSRFQARIWGGIKETWPGAREGDTAQPYYKVIEQRRAAGQPIFDDVTLSRFNKHETSVAKEIDDLFQSKGVVHPEAAAPEASTFDWGKGTENNASGESAASVEAINRQRSEATAGVKRLVVDQRTGKSRPLLGPDAVDYAPSAHEVVVTEKAGKRTIVSEGQRVTSAGRTKAKRPGQTGEVKLAALLPVDAFLKAAKGVRSLAEYTKGATARWGEGVRPYLPAAWKTGATRATKLAALGERSPESRMPVENPATPQRAARVSPLDRVGPAEDHSQQLLDQFSNPLHVPDHESLARLERFRAATARDEGRPYEARQHAVEAERIEAAPRTPEYIRAAREKLGYDRVQEVIAPYAGDVMAQKLALGRAASPRGRELLGSLTRAGVIWNFLGRSWGTGVAAKVAAINAVRATSRVLATIPGAGYSKVFHRGGQHVFMNELTPGQQGFTHAFGPALGHAWEIITKGHTSDDLMTARGLPQEEIQHGPALVRGAIYAPQRALGAVDRIFVETLAEHDTAQLMTTNARARALREGRTDVQERVAELKAEWQEHPPDWALEHKERLAHRMSDQAGFANETWVGQAANTILQLNRIPVIGPLLAPFTKSILNASRSAVQASPYGFYDVYKLRQAQTSDAAAGNYGDRHGYGRAEMQRGRASGALAREEAMRFGESVVGTAILGLAAYAGIFNGAITGAAPRGMSKSERDERLSQRPDSAIHTPAGWTPIASTLGHLAPLVQAVADAHEQYVFDTRDNPKHPEKVKDAYEAAINAAATGAMTMVKGIPLLDRGDPGSQQFYRTLFNAVPFVPGVGKNVVAMVDPYQRQAKGVLQEVMSATPGLSTRLQARIRATGEAFERPPLVSPFSTTPPSPNDARNMASAAGYRVPVPNIAAITDNDGNRRALPLGWSRPMNSAIGYANARALNRAKDQITPDMDRDDIAAEFKAAVDENRKVVLDNARAAIDANQRPTIEALTQGLE